MVRRIIRITLSPRDEWQRIAGEGWLPALGYAAVLSLVPAAASLVMKETSPLPLAEHTVAATYAAFLGGIVLLAVAFFAMKRAAWPTCMKIAAYGATPVLAGAACLVTPVLVIVPMIGMVYAFYLYYLGVQALLAIAEQDAAVFVAVAMVGAFAVSTLLGSAAGAMGLL